MSEHAGWKESFEQNVRWLRWLGCFDEVLAWYEGKTVDRITLKRKKGGWSLILAAHEGNRRLVLFTDGDTPMDAIAELGRMVSQGGTRWRTDRYPPNMGD